MRAFRDLLVFVILSCLSGAVAAQDGPVNLQPLPPDFCAQLFDLEEPVFGSKEPVQQIIEMQFEGRLQPITLPRDYLEDMWDFNQGYTVPSHGFRVDLQGFDPVRSRDRRAFWDEHGRRDMSIVIGDTAVDLQRQHEIGLSVYYVDPDRHGGLTERYVAALDLTRVEPARPHPMHKIFYKFHLASGELTDSMNCGKPGDGGVQQSCRHVFRAQGVDVSAVYAADYLPQWKQIKANVDTFLGCMLSNGGTEE